MDVVALVTTIDRRTRRVPVHFVRESVLDLQAQAIGLPIWKIEVDATFLDQLPQSVDPCGENGEFHTVVCGGPGFVRPLRLRVGHSVDDGSFVVVDAQPATSVQGG